MIFCDECGGKHADYSDHLCLECCSKWEKDVKLVGDFSEEVRQAVLRKMFCSCCFDSADRRHGVVVIKGVVRFQRNELLRALSSRFEAWELDQTVFKGDTYLAKKYYRDYGYSLEEFEHKFSSR